MLDRIISGGQTGADDACRVQCKPFLIVFANRTRPSEGVEWTRVTGVRVLNVVGDRESVSPGAGDRVERFLARVFGQLAQ